MKEIGSEFWDPPFQTVSHGSLFPPQTKWFLSGRTALNVILDDILSKHPCCTAALPSWCCDSMIQPFADHGLQIRFYPVVLGQGRRLVQDLQSAESCDIVLALDYFGFHTAQKGNNCRGIVIRDLTHSFLCDIPEQADYCFGSTRKWGGIWSGGYAWAKDGILPEFQPTNELHPYIAARKAAMLQKKKYMSDAESNDKQYLKLLGYSEEWLDRNTERCGAAQRDIALLKNADWDSVRKKRRENAAFLLGQLGQYSFVPELGPKDCPLFVPVFLMHDLRDQLRSYLIGQKIYCPVHWPVSSYHRLNDETRRIYDEELSIICDQRYDISDMQQICNEVVSFINSYKGA